MKNILIIGMLLIASLIQAQFQTGIEVTAFNNKIYPGINLGYNFQIEKNSIIPNLSVSPFYLKGGVSYSKSFFTASIYQKYHWYKKEQRHLNNRYIIVKYKEISTGVNIGVTHTIKNHLVLSFRLGNEFVINNSRPVRIAAELQIIYRIWKN